MRDEQLTIPVNRNQQRIARQHQIPESFVDTAIIVYRDLDHLLVVIGPG